MYINLHEVPAGKSLFTVAFTNMPLDTPDADRDADTTDVITFATATALDLIELTRDEVDGARVVGIINQSDAYVVIEDWAGVKV